MTRKLDFSDVSLYAITSGAQDQDEFVAQVEKTLKGGVDALQLRAHGLKDAALINLGRKLKKKCAEHNALFIVNNRPDIANVIDADGVHVGHEDMPIPLVRELIGHRKIIGASTHSIPQALDAQKKGADYVSCGPIWATPTKPDYDPVGLSLIGFYKAALRVPFVVIGGVNEKNIGEVVEKGASCVAVVRALFGAANPETVARELKQKILKKQLVS